MRCKLRYVVYGRSQGKTARFSSHNDRYGAWSAIGLHAIELLDNGHEAKLIWWISREVF